MQNSGPCNRCVCIKIVHCTCYLGILFSFSQQGDILDDTELPDGNTVRQRKVNTDKDGGDDTDNTQATGSTEQNKQSEKKKD